MDELALIAHLIQCSHPACLYWLYYVLLFKCSVAIPHSQWHAWYSDLNYDLHLQCTCSCLLRAMHDDASLWYNILYCVIIHHGNIRLAIFLLLRLSLSYRAAKGGTWWQN